MSATRTTTPWRRPDVASALVCWRDTQLATLAQALERALQGWRDDWGLPLAGAVTCLAATGGQPPLAWQGLDRDGAPAGWLHVPEDATATLRELIFPGSAAAERLASTVAAACEHDGLQRLLDALGLAHASAVVAAPADADTRRWSGAVEVRCAEPLPFRLVLRADAMAAWWREHGTVDSPASQPFLPLARVGDAVAGLPLALDVQLAGCELDLATLQRLQAGDILRMPHPIELPARVCNAAGEALFSAYLGRQANARAVELAPLRAATAPTSQEKQP